MTDHDRELGAFDARLEALEKVVERLDKTTSEIRDVMMMGKALSRIGAYAGALLLVVIGAVVGQFFSWLWPVR